MNEPMIVATKTRCANLDLATLRSFVLIAQGRTFAEAADMVGRSQSAVSLQIQRLETDVGSALLLRNRQGVALTHAGERLLVHAQRLIEINDEAVRDLPPHASRTLTWGVIPDLAETVVPKILAQFHQLHPDIDITLRIDTSRRLVDMLRREELDLVVGLAVDDVLNQSTLAETPMVWIAREGFRYRADQRLFLALIEPPCPFRDCALDALHSDCAFRIAVTSPGLSGILSSVKSGCYITARTKYLLTPGLTDIGTQLNLPPLPNVRFSLYARPGEKRRGCDDLMQICRQHMG